MGNEAKCIVGYDGESAEAKVLLETDELIVRAPFRLRIPFGEMKTIDADDKRLLVRWSSHQLALPIGREARKWAEKIRNPKTLAEKLGIKAGQKISIVGQLEKEFIEQLQQRGADVSRRVRRGSDIIFLAVESRKQTDRLFGFRKLMAADGAVWVIRPRGSDAISEGEVMAAAKETGLVDVKVVRFSATHTAEKFVIPANDREKHRNGG
jgi:hypothetical protein